MLTPTLTPILTPTLTPTPNLTLSAPAQSPEAKAKADCRAPLVGGLPGRGGNAIEHLTGEGCPAEGTPYVVKGLAPLGNLLSAVGSTVGMVAVCIPQCTVG